MWVFKQIQTFALLDIGLIAAFIMKVPDFTLQLDDS